MDEREELLPCPFCGGTNIEIRPNKIGDFYAICYSNDRSEQACGASTGDQFCETPEGAARRWNLRAPQPACPEGWRPISEAPELGEFACGYQCASREWYWHKYDIRWARKYGYTHYLPSLPAPPAGA